MIHPLLRLAATEPHLLGDHVEAYAALVGEEVTKVSTSWATRIGLYLAALLLLAIGLVLVGVALMFCAALPATGYPAAWALIVVPLVPLAGAVVCVMIARSRPIENGFDSVKKQLNADMAMLREVSTP
jgi:cytochrome bd-type quinol oxidase subunit 2